MNPLRANLNGFLAALHAQGIPIGSDELARLRHVLNLEPSPSWDRERLHELLACTLAKTPAQREIFEQEFEVWCPEDSIDEAMEAPEASAKAIEPQPAEPGLRTEEAPPRETDNVLAQVRPPPQPMESAKRKRRWPRMPWSLTRQVSRFLWPVLGLLALGWLGIIEGDIRLLSQLWPMFFGFDQPTGYSDALMLLVGIGVWGLSVALAWRYREHAAFPKAAESPEEGPRWLPRLELENTGAVLLDTDQRRALVWGVGRFVAEDLTPELDLPCTVAATARGGGIPEIRYQRAIYPREVWLWQDDAVSDSALERLVSELETDLAQAGLPVRRGVFAEVPDPVRWQEGEEFSPLVLEGHRQNALVAVLTDGVGMQIASEDALNRRLLHNLLYRFAEWSQLVFVDFSHERRVLEAMLQPHGLRCIAPRDLPVFLGAEQVLPPEPQPVEERLLGDLRAWAAATALSPEPVSGLACEELRRALGLDISPWRFRDLARHADDLGGSIGWPPDRRTELLNWLAQVECPTSGDEIPAQSVSGRALDYWLKIYRDERTRREQWDRNSDRFMRWRRTPAEQQCLLEEALLTLWRDPKTATRELYRLYGVNPNRGGLRDEIEERLAQLAPRDFRGRATKFREVVFLPWAWGDQPAKVCRMLWEMGFGRNILPAPEPLRTPGTAALALGLGLGVAGAVFVAVGGVVGVLLSIGALGSAVPLARRLTKEAKPLPAEPVEQIRIVEDIPGLLEMIELPGGTFMMGSPDSDDQAYENEKPQHEVTVSDFCLGRYPVTRALYREVMGGGPSEWSDDADDGSLPANYVSWRDAVRFCNALSKKQGLRPCYRILWWWVTWDREADGYCLPTEAEWEYAVRAGTTTRWFFGDDSVELERYAWFDKNSGKRVHSVGENEPNPWGFHDMAGNVWEWCWDRYYGDYAAAPLSDPIGPDGGRYRVLRGGACWVEARLLRSADRFRNRPWDRFDAVFVGFRVARAPRRQP